MVAPRNASRESTRSPGADVAIPTAILIGSEATDNRVGQGHSLSHGVAHGQSQRRRSTNSTAWPLTSTVTRGDFALRADKLPALSPAGPRPAWRDRQGRGAPGSQVMPQATPSRPGCNPPPPNRVQPHRSACCNSSDQFRTTSSLRVAYSGSGSATMTKRPSGPTS